MLIGHVEKEHHRVDHLRRLRELQDETNGFTAFVTLAFHPDNTKLPELTGPSGYDMLKTLAIARIYLDNIDHIKAYWVLMGMKLAQVSLSYGVDDLDGTVMEEKIYHMAGAKTPQEMAREELVKAIRETGREPVQRDSLYRPVKAHGTNRDVSPATQAEAGNGLGPAETAYAGASNEGGAA
jgi:aminodeoxyfutalosine synthase